MTDFTLDAARIERLERGVRLQQRLTTIAVLLLAGAMTAAFQAREIRV